MAQAFSGMLAEIEEAGFITVDEASTSAAARMQVADDQVSTAYLIPEGFSNAVGMNQQAVITVVANPDQPIGAQVGTAMAEGKRLPRLPRRWAAATICRQPWIAAPISAARPSSGGARKWPIAISIS